MFFERERFKNTPTLEKGSEKCFKLSVFGFITASGQKIVQGCQICDKSARGRLLEWRGFEEEYKDLLRAAELLDCLCKKNWQEEILKVPEHDLKARAAIEIDKLSRYGI